MELIGIGLTAMEMVMAAKRIKDDTGKVLLLLGRIILFVGLVYLALYFWDKYSTWKYFQDINSCEFVATERAAERYPYTEYPDTAQREKLQNEYIKEYIASRCRN